MTTVSTLLRREPDDNDPVPDRAGAAPPPAAQELQERVEAAQARIQLQHHPALFEMLSDAELTADRKVAEEVRAAEREQTRKSGLAAARRAGKDRRAADREADIDAGDRVWHRRALSARRRAMSADARLAQVARARRWITLGLAAVIATGVLVSSVTVQHNMAAGQTWRELTWWVWFFVDPMLSVPLVMLLLVRGIGVQWGRTLDSRLVNVTEVGLLVVMSLLNVGPYLAHAGKAGIAGVLGHLIAPGMVALGVLLAPAITGFLAGIIADAIVDVDSGRLDEDSANAMAYARRVVELVAEGKLTADLTSPDTPWLPSTSAIQKFFGIGKPTAQKTHDALKIWFPNADSRR